MTDDEKAFQDFFDVITSDETQPPCPKCSSMDLHFGYGFAAGGIGSYTICLSCGETFDIEPDPDAACPAGTTRNPSDEPKAD